MEIRRIESDLLRSNMYVVCENGHAIVIDPCRDTSPAEGLQVDMILLTHEHYDHISGVNAWKERTGAMVVCSETCGVNIKSARKSLSKFFDVFCEMQTWMVLQEPPDADLTYTCQADETFSDETKLMWQGHCIKLMELPGHSAGSIGILIDGVEFFSGDSLMKDYEVELRFPGGSEKQWREIGEPRVRKLPRGIRIWPGHFEPFSLE